MIIRYFTASIIPIVILLILVFAIKEKKDVFLLFVEGVYDGLKIVYKIFPYIFAITIAIGLFKVSGAINIFAYPLRPILDYFNIPEDILPLIILRPMSGSASTSLVMEIFKTQGPDSISGKLASLILGGTETTIYVITILIGSVGMKRARGSIFAGLLANLVAVIVAVAMINLNIV